MFKKLALLTGFASSAFLATGQGIKFGMHVAPLVSFMGSNDERVKSSAASAGFGVGIEAEYYFMESEKVALAFGVDFSLGKGGRMLYKYGGHLLPNSDNNFDAASYQLNPDLTDISAAIISGNLTNVNQATQSGVDSAGIDFAAFTRIKHTANYLEVPLSLKFRPAEFGDWKILLQVPIIRAMIPVSSRAKIFSPDTEADGYVNDFYGYRLLDDATTSPAIYKDVVPFQLSAGLGVGAEWAPTDKWRVFAGLYYEASLLDMTKKIQTREAVTGSSNALAEVAALAYHANRTYSDKNPRMAPHTLGLRVGFLFVP